jgi:hypothetical protein
MLSLPPDFNPVDFVLRPITAEFGVDLEQAVLFLVDWAEYAFPCRRRDLRSWLERRRSARHCLTALAQTTCAGPTARLSYIHLRYGRRYARDAIKWDRLLYPA